MNYYTPQSVIVSVVRPLTLIRMILAGLSVLQFVIHSPCGAWVDAQSYVFRSTEIINFAAATADAALCSRQDIKVYVLPV